MFSRLAAGVTGRPRVVLTLTLIFVLGAAVLGVGAFGKLLDGGFDDPKSDSSRAADIVEDRFGGAPNLVLLVTARSGTVDDPAVTAAGRSLAAELAEEPGVRGVASYWTGAGEVLRSRDADAALVVATVDEDHADAVVAKYDADRAGPVTVQPGGWAAVNRDIGEQVTTDLATAELVAIPVTLVLLIIAFAGVVAAALPLGVGLVGILGGFAALSVIAEATDVSIFAVNLATALGLGLGIDYALLMVSRFREELAARRDRRAATVATVRTAGRTILFSGATVIVALAVMLVFPPFFLKSMAYAGIAVTLVTMLTAVLALPAVLYLLGDRVNALRVGGLVGLFRRRGAGKAAAGAAAAGPAPAEAPREATESPFWRAVATRVMRRPLLTGLPVVALLLLLAAPVLHVSFATPDDRVLNPGKPSRAVGDVLRSDFGDNISGALDVVVTGQPAAEALTDYATALSRLPGAGRVDSAVGEFQAGARTAPPGPASARFATDGATYLQVVPSIDPMSDAGQDLARAARALPVPAGSSVLVGGTSAYLVDGKSAIGDRLPLAIGLISLATFVLLFLFTGSVLLPLKAIVLNGLVLGAVVGVSVWIFQDGHLAGLLGFTPGPLDTSMPVLLFCIAFGLSMDYEVFLLSRIKEEHDAGKPNAEAVATGLARTGRIVTTAALLLAVTFAAFATGSVRFMQMFGLGTALAILLDASLVRGVLVPAFMRVAGRANWWAPAPLRWLHDRVGLSESAPVAPAVTVPAPATEPAGLPSPTTPSRT
ncbi:MMPL family transporter [Frankia sp. CNm7]|uniref:MMPL family transporter n=1 Tax=Frankia nepalensis TaxID=1836974 RepID=A0A937UTH1_9ACTN|nr:MMPL family transporter [Frankia nepalensis]MBL7499912.1 MMPL family transporter [Frankia nepalensis]MBL7515416.1 MMPL family transporter [Frankia nepalensis]MBL7517872.1 MMPL family transporter [Frankia nepalensis]MBL7633103.1 MMPL family transporter [Frankia nepalensis]